MNTRWTYKIDGVQVHPLDSRSYELKWELEDQFIYDYRLTFSGTVVLVGADYTYLKSLEASKRFQKINFKIFDTGVERYNGEFVMSDCEFDPYKFNASLKVTARDQYTVIQEIEDVEVDIVDGDVQMITAEIYSYWYYYCTRTTGGAGSDTSTSKLIYALPLGFGIYVNLMVTELVKVDADAPVPSGFGSTPFADLDKYKVYQRFPVGYDLTYTFDYMGPVDLSDYQWSAGLMHHKPFDETLYNLIKISFGLSGVDIDFSLLWVKKSAYNFRANAVAVQAYRGIELKSVMNRIIDFALPTFTGNVVSSFLFSDSDPGGGTTATDAYAVLGFTPGQYGKYLIEMSDFRRPNAGEPASIGILTWKQISEYLCQKYGNRLRWHIDTDGNIRFELITYFDISETETDLTANPHITQKYRYIDAGKPNRLSVSESSAWNEDFAEIDVLYGTMPAVAGQKENKQSISLSKIFTDIDGLNQHLDSLSDDGFVFVEVYKTDTVIGTEPLTNTYGDLYNWNAASDARNLAASGWRVPEFADWEDLSDYLGGNTVAGGKLKTTGTTYWTSPNTGATNSSQFTALGGGLRSSPAGAFSELLNRAYFWSADAWSASDGYISYLLYSNAQFYSTRAGIVIYTMPKMVGASVRLIKDSTTLEHGQAGTYIGNDGREYETICIGTQEWLAENLKETKFRNGDTIPVVTDASAWIALTTAGKCTYDTGEGVSITVDAFSVVKGTGFKSTDIDLQNVFLSNANCLNLYHRYRTLQDVYYIGGKQVYAISIQRMKYQQIEFAVDSMPDIEKEIVTITGNGMVKSIKFAPTVEHKYIAELLYD